MYKMVAVLVLASLPAFSADWKLLWSDEFNGPANTPPDPTKWVYDLGGGGWGNKELETYTNNASNAAEDGEGHLAIRAVRAADGKITSARLKTRHRFAVTYGKIAARMKIPTGQGMWPAFWMLGTNDAARPWPKCGEIDVMENIGKEPATVHSTVHGPGYSSAHAMSGTYQLPDEQPLWADFHVYALEWSPDAIRFSFDDHEYFSVTPASLPKGSEWVYDHPFFLLLNLAVGGGWPGNPDKSPVFPGTLLVDWVRVWKAA